MSAILFPLGIVTYFGTINPLMVKGNKKKIKVSNLRVSYLEYDRQYIITQRHRKI